MTDDRYKSLAHKIREFFPNFHKVEQHPENPKHDARVYVTRSHRILLTGSPSWNKVLGRLKEEHRCQTIRKDLEGMYPNLKVHVRRSKMGDHLSIWSSESEYAMGKISYIHRKRLHERLEMLNDLAGRAEQDGYFWCSGHGRVEPKENYGYFYFTGRFCEEYGEENPEHRKKAKQETYR